MTPRSGPDVTWPMLPMKAVAGVLPTGDGWVYEPKWDGHRALVRVRGDRLDVRSSTGKDRTTSWPFLNELAAGHLSDSVIDGEIVAFDAEGRHRFQLVGRPGHLHAFVAFDVVAHDGRDLTRERWEERRTVLAEVITSTPHVMITPVTTDAAAMVDLTRDRGFEGLIAKRTDSLYLAGRRSTAWRKVKHRMEQEFVVGGYLTGEGHRLDTFGSLLVGVYEGHHLRFAGAVGSGFDDRTLVHLARVLDALSVDHCPFDPAPMGVSGRARWVAPSLVAQVAFAEWTEDARLRHPVFLGLRDDREPFDVTRSP